MPWAYNSGDLAIGGRARGTRETMSLFSRVWTDLASCQRLLGDSVQWFGRSAPCGRVDLGRQVLRGGRRRRREKLRRCLQRRHDDCRTKQWRCSSFYALAQRSAIISRGSHKGRTVTWLRTGTWTRQHGRGSGTPVCALIRCDRFVGPFGWRHCALFLLFIPFSVYLPSRFVLEYLRVWAHDHITGLPYWSILVVLFA